MIRMIEDVFSKVFNIFIEK